MPNLRSRIRMTDEEINAFLDDAWTIHVASIGPDGAPHLVPMWFIRDGSTIQFWTFGKSQKILNLRRDPRVTIMAEAGTDYSELRGVTIQGRAEIVEDVARISDFAVRCLGKYYGDQPGGAEELAASAMKRVLVIVRPESIASWDHRKIPHQL